MNAQFELEVGDIVAIRRLDQEGVVANGPRETHGTIVRVYQPWWAALPRYLVELRGGDLRPRFRYKRSEISYIDPELDARLDALLGVNR